MSRSWLDRMHRFSSRYHHGRKHMEPSVTASRDPALAYQFGNTSVVLGEEAEILKKYDIPRPPRADGLSETTRSTSENGGAVQAAVRFLETTAAKPLPPDAQVTNEKKEKLTGIESDDDFDKRLSVIAGGRTMSMADFMQHMSQMRPRERDEFIQNNVVNVPERTNSCPITLERSQSSSLCSKDLAPYRIRQPCRASIVEGGHEDLADGSDLPFEYRDRLGYGASAVIDVVEDKNNGRIFAHKEFQTYSGNDKLFKKTFKKEVDVIKRLASHPHIIHVYWSYTVGRQFGMLLTPVASHKDLGAYLLAIQDTGEPPTSEQYKTLYRAFGCLSGGLSYIHNRTIRHKDIKPKNILVHHGQMIYTDFGSALDTGGQSMTTTGMAEAFTRRYCAPEVANNESRNRKSDVFSLGCVFLEIFATMNPYFDHVVSDPLPYHTRLEDVTSVISSFMDSSLGVGDLQILCTCLHMLCSESKLRPASHDITADFVFVQRYAAEQFFCPACASPDLPCASSTAKWLDNSAIRVDTSCDNNSVSSRISEELPKSPSSKNPAMINLAEPKS